MNEFYFENNGAFWKSVWKGINDDATVTVNTIGATGGWGTIAMVSVVIVCCGDGGESGVAQRELFNRTAEHGRVKI